MSSESPLGSVVHSANEDIRRFMRRLERLAKFLIGRRFTDTAGLWHFQRDLIRLQQDIQKSIKEERQHIRKSKVKSERLNDLQYARWNARRLGDAFAWPLLGLNPQIIQPLAENDPVPIAQEDHGSRGLIAISAYLADQGWGFPLIHDVTDCLRIGDVTFVRPEGKEWNLRTVEMKTRLLGQSGGKDGAPVLHYNVSVSFLSSESDPKINFIADINEENKNLNQTEDSKLVDDGHTRRDDRRISRQTRRMATALSRQKAEDGKVLEINGRKTISITVEGSAFAHWKMLRRIIRKARLNGYASECVDKAFLYVAFYHPEGVTPDIVQDQRIIDDVTLSQLLSSKKPARNSIEISSIPTRESRRAQLFLPYFLYSIPQRAIFDLLHGRLMIIVLTNAGHIADALESKGFEVVIPPGKESPTQSIKVSSVTTCEGKQYHFGTNALGRHIADCIYEFKGLDHLLQVAYGMRDATIPVIVDNLKKSQGSE